MTSASPVLARTRAELAEGLGRTHRAGGRVGLVPTMGALHDGHISLMKEAATRLDEDGALVVSIFVNPLQFGVHEDLAAYPRTLEADLRRCAEASVDVVFAPSVDEVYPGGEPQVSVDPGPLATVLEGRSRPTHFRGVLTVVAKLFGLVRPDFAVFGEKDYQQLVLIRQMVQDLCLGIDVVGGCIVREADGLAMSSRNAYLDDSPRRQATVLSKALRRGASVGREGPGAVLAAARDVLDAEPGVVLDYLELTGPDLRATVGSGPGRLLVAARLGTTRLIDNVAVTLG